ncbi:MAG: PCRF domain-containing protein, partial [Burkholderiaceae bacterium]|nr:PCRF domain-containing protein [Burkholderiaceae bacterium]
MKASMRARLEQLALRLSDLNTLLSTQDASRDAAEFRRLHREHAELTQVVDHFENFRRAQSDFAAAKQMLSDPEMAE